MAMMKIGIKELKAKIGLLKTATEPFEVVCYGKVVGEYIPRKVDTIVATTVEKKVKKVATIKEKVATIVATIKEKVDTIETPEVKKELPPKVKLAKALERLEAGQECRHRLAYCHTCHGN
jgi:hypothetical protein